MEYDYIECGNCLDLLKKLPDNSIDLTVTSPPYDNLRNYKGYSFDFENIAKELYRVTKQGGIVVWVVNDATVKGSETGTSFKQALFFKDIGFNIHDTMIWNKGSCQFPETIRYYPVFEYMFIFSKGKPKTFNAIEDRKNKTFGQKISGTERQVNGELKPLSAIRLKSNRAVKEFGFRFNVWNIPQAKNNKTGHPAVFPEQLVRDHILSWSNENDVVLDPFLGSGTTAVACVNTNRHYICFEIAPTYYEIACNRVDEAKKIFNQKVEKYST